MALITNLRTVCRRITNPVFGEGLCGVFADGLSKYLNELGIAHEIRSNQDHAVVVIGSRVFHAAPWPENDPTQFPEVGHQFVTWESLSEVVYTAFKQNLSAASVWELWQNQFN